MTSANAWDAEEAQSYAPAFLTALAVVVSLVAAFGGWGLYARLDGAVVTQGVLLAESQRKTIESLEGGILARLLVAPGDRVMAGQPVAELDATQERELLAQMRAEQDALLFDVWRLEAEEAGAADLDPAAAPVTGQDERADRIAAQIRLFDARLGAHEGQIASLERQIDLLAAQAGANEGRAQAAERQIASWTEERVGSERLVSSGASARQTLRELDRSLAILEGERDEYRGLATAAREDMARAVSDIRTLEQQRLADAAQGRVDARRALAGLDAQIRATQDVLDRRTLRASQDGVVVDIPAVTPGSVISSGAAVMEIVPNDDPLVVQIRLAPEAVDTVYPGRAARVRLTVYRRASSPVVDGEVVYVSADLLEDSRDGARYFEGRVALDEDDLDALPDIDLSPGMPVEVAIQTGERRAGDYMLEPILRHFRRAMREE